MTTNPTPALDLWEAEVTSGHAGQDPEHPETWVQDELYQAAALEFHASLAELVGCPAAASRMRTLAADAMLRPEAA